MRTFWVTIHNLEVLVEIALPKSVDNLYPFPIFVKSLLSQSQCWEPRPNHILSICFSIFALVVLYEMLYFLLFLLLLLLFLLSCYFLPCLLLFLSGKNRTQGPALARQATLPLNYIPSSASIFFRLTPSVS